MRRLPALIALAVLAGIVPALGSGGALARPVADPDGAIAAAATSLTDGLTWYSLDGHVHTDHSHDAGFFHQQEKKPENHDTFVADQLAEAQRNGETIATLTDHRTYDQAYDPEYRSDTMTLLDGIEWGGPHSTAWGISEMLEVGPDEGTCGVARAAGEVRAMDAIFGVAHPEDGRPSCIDVSTLRNVPIDHLEAFRAPHTAFYERNLAGGNRLVPVTGSDNHFRQLYGSEGGTGISSTFILASSPTQAAIVEAVRAGRVFSTTRTLGPRLTTFLDADMDGTFDALTGGWAASGGGTVRVAFNVTLGTGHWLQVLDAASNIVAQEAITLPDQTFAFDLPGTAGLYRGQLTIEPVERVSGPSYLSYADTLRVLSAPVYLSAPPLVENGTQDAPGGATALGGAPFSGYADVAVSDGVAHAVWQERVGGAYRVMYARSLDGGTTWESPRTLSPFTHAGPRFPSVAADGARVAVVYQATSDGRHDGSIFLWSSDDGGATFTDTALASGARPDVTISGDAILVAWMSQEDGYKIRMSRVVGDDVGAPLLLSSAVARNGGSAHPMSIPPRTLRHIPAAVHPVIVARGSTVAVAWEDNREDPTPLRNGTPDDWGIYGTVSTDGGLTFAPDRRWTPRHDRRAGTPAKPEDMQGNPAKHPDLLLTAGGALVLAYDDPFPSDGANVYVRRSEDLGASWSGPATVSGPSAELETRPRLREVGGAIEVIFQASFGRAWSLRRAVSADGGLTFAGHTAFTTGTGFAGFPAVAGDVVVWTGEQAGPYRVFVARG